MRHLSQTGSRHGLPGTRPAAAAVLVISPEVSPRGLTGPCSPSIHAGPMGRPARLAPHGTGSANWTRRSSRSDRALRTCCSGWTWRSNGPGGSNRTSRTWGSGWTLRTLRTRCARGPLWSFATSQQYERSKSEYQARHAHEKAPETKSFGRGRVTRAMHQVPIPIFQSQSEAVVKFWGAPSRTTDRPLSS